MEVLAPYSSAAYTSWDGDRNANPVPSNSWNKQRTNSRFVAPPPVPAGPVAIGTAAAVCVPAIPAVTTSPLPEAPRRWRRGHTKSRAGCFNCKRLKVKCKENRPECDYCAHRGMKCEWPKLLVREGQTRVLLQKPRSPATVPEQALTTPYGFQSQIPVFTMLDSRLFDYFIQHAHPQHPRGSKEVWQHDVPCLASNYGYLLHSMLALSASELALTEPSPQHLHHAALTHRTRSITYLNTAIQRGVNSFEEGNAMIATCFSLLFQSTLISDGLVEYMTFMRGTVVVASQMSGSQMRFLFEKLAEMSESQFENEIFEEVITDDRPIVHPHVVVGACRSFERFKSLCRSESEVQIFEALYDIACSLHTASASAYLKLRRVYQIFACTMPHDDFRHYCDPNNQVGQILQAHFVALQLIMNPITLQTQGFKGRRCPVKHDSRVATKGWLAAIHRGVQREWRRYFEWTMWIECEIAKGRITRIFDERVGEGEEACPFKGRT